MAVAKDPRSRGQPPIPLHTTLNVIGKNQISFAISFQLPGKGGKDNKNQAAQAGQPVLSLPRESNTRDGIALTAGALPAATVPALPTATADAIDAVLQVLIDEADAERPMLESRDEEARARLEALLRSRKYTNASVHLFGSSASGLRTGRSSDVDLCVHVPNGAAQESPRNGQPPPPPKKLAFQLASLLRGAPGYSKVEAVAHAKVPLVKTIDTRAKGVAFSTVCTVCPVCTAPAPYPLRAIPHRGGLLSALASRRARPTLPALTQAWPTCSHFPASPRASPLRSSVVRLPALLFLWLLLWLQVARSRAMWSRRRETAADRTAPPSRCTTRSCSRRTAGWSRATASSCWWSSSGPSGAA